jgi:hypothetical protein
MIWMKRSSRDPYPVLRQQLLENGFSENEVTDIEKDQQ